ncbi:MAG: hypothetical protein KatS3mg068_2223 [Candidatus Sericytochromatia bacterium]|nr:MAG: hypothetical protein KatS3mg068_2223 [Candidatus Sericytochromatia bacterium]
MSDNIIRSDNPVSLNNNDIKVNNANKSKITDIDNIPLFDKKIDNNILINLVKTLESLGYNHSK